jgi:hypothetical protein
MRSAVSRQDMVPLVLMPVAKHVHSTSNSRNLLDSIFQVMLLWYYICKG